MLVRERSQMTKHVGIMEFHAAGPLHQRLYNNGGDRIAPVLQQFVEGSGRGRIFRQVDDVMLGQNAGKTGVHAGVQIADGHRPECVAVICPVKSHKLFFAARSAVDPILRRHLQRDLDRDRSGVGEKYPLQAAGEQSGKPPGKP